MPVAEASRRSCEVRVTRRDQRLTLRGLSPRELVPILLDAPPELASYRLRDLFAARNTNTLGPIPGFGERSFDRMIEKLWEEGNWWAKEETRLRNLTTVQRRRLLRAVLEFAPVEWSGGNIREPKPSKTTTEAGLTASGGARSV